MGYWKGRRELVVLLLLHRIQDDACRAFRMSMMS